MCTSVTIWSISMSGSRIPTVTSVSFVMNEDGPSVWITWDFDRDSVADAPLVEPGVVMDRSVHLERTDSANPINQ